MVLFITYFISSDLILCCLILSYLVLSYFLFSCLILSHLILSYPILSYPILCYHMLCYAMLCYVMLSYAILSYSIPFHSNHIPSSNPIQFHLISSIPIQSHLIPSHLILSQSCHLTYSFPLFPSLCQALLPIEIASVDSEFAIGCVCIALSAIKSVISESCLDGMKRNGIE